jgi:hypothetical protein
MKRMNAVNLLGRHSRANLAALLLASLLLVTGSAAVEAETCTTQSALQQAERDTIASAARNLATKVQGNDAVGLRATSVAELTKDFGALQYLAAVTAPKLAGGVPLVEQLYVLDATNLKRNPDGSALNAQFFCSLNRSTMEAEFDIPALPPGRYAFVMVNIVPQSGPNAAAAWRLSFLLRQEPAGQGSWLLAGFYPRPMTAAGHDGLWYWTQARQMVKDKQLWNAWLYYREAQKLLQPADFVLSTHLDKLHSEIGSAAPPALSDGISIDTPLVVKGADGSEFHFTGLDVDDSQSSSNLDLTVHFRADPLPDPVAARKRNDAAASALLAAYPELRKPFHAVRVISEAQGQNPFPSEQPMSEIK